MEWSTQYIYRTQYDWASSNQHGNRFKKIGTKQIPVAQLRAEITSANDLKDLILLSYHLQVPVQYDFETTPQTAFIEVVAKEKIEE